MVAQCPSNLPMFSPFPPLLLLPFWCIMSIQSHSKHIPRSLGGGHSNIQSRKKAHPNVAGLVFCLFFYFRHIRARSLYYPPHSLYFLYPLFSYLATPTRTPTAPPPHHHTTTPPTPTQTNTNANLFYSTLHRMEKFKR